MCLHFEHSFRTLQSATVLQLLIMIQTTVHISLLFRCTLSLRTIFQFCFFFLLYNSKCSRVFVNNTHWFQWLECLIWFCSGWLKRDTVFLLLDFFNFCKSYNYANWPRLICFSKRRKTYCIYAKSTIHELITWKWKPLHVRFALYPHDEEKKHNYFIVCHLNFLANDLNLVFIEFASPNNNNPTS